MIVALASSLGSHLHDSTITSPSNNMPVRFARDSSQSEKKGERKKKSGKVERFTVGMLIGKSKKLSYCLNLEYKQWLALR
ncbi:hypothetical protein TNCT_543061 [Trichonephila clavata]|uniref:Uncharacterized protein n=1 Tax=Trichonephila clavata TaxID=2740835 RepID=A0A8X6FVA2_TRICU|nr:hypothetical protein TNCT_543061 [Trichonephila clavata]